MVGYSNDLGSIHYSEEVLAKIVGLSTMECYGVVGMVSKNATEGLWELMRIENLSKGIEELIENDELRINMGKESLTASKELTLDNYYLNFIELLGVNNEKL